jgi:ribose 5-phosphate isomerase RpiB
MKIAVVSEVSSADKNAAVVAALEGRGHEVVNLGMKDPRAVPALGYVHTGLLTGILLNLGRADLVVGGCGTGQGYAQAAMMCPGVFCGQVTAPLDAWLFAQINGGNCLSLRLNQGFGWAGDVNLRMIFDAFFSVERGAGYPPHRREAQKASRALLAEVSTAGHRPFAQVVTALPDEVLQPVLAAPGVLGVIDVDSIDDEETRKAFRARLRAGTGKEVPGRGGR